MRGLRLGAAVTLVWLGPDEARRFVADLPKERWFPAGPYQSLAPLCRQPAQEAGSREGELLEFPVRETWHILECDSKPSGHVWLTPRVVMAEIRRLLIAGIRLVRGIGAREACNYMGDNCQYKIFVTVTVAGP
jgi:hypothetical protein